jgi:LmbE family N-acetylglucosaminyl deacetylase
LTIGEYLAAIRQLPLGSLQQLTAGSPIVVLSPHPDDESLGAGGLIAAACKVGQRINVVVITDGAGSHPRSQLYPYDLLVGLRRAEVDAAGTLLGLAPDCVSHLDLPDTKAPSSGPSFEAAVNAIAETCRMADAKSLFVTWDRDPHCDHEATARMAEAVRRKLPGLRLWAYPIWGWHLDAALSLDRPEPTGFRLDISEQQAIKRAAIAAHVSQMTDLIDDDPDGFCFTERTLAPFLGPFEYFIEVAT